MRLNNKENDDLDVIVMTDAGKLIFSRFDHYGNDDDDDDEEEEHLSSFCGFVQAIRGSMLNDSGLNNGDLQFISANESKICFMHAGCITLVAIAKNQRRNDEMNSSMVKTYDHKVEQYPSPNTGLFTIQQDDCCLSHDDDDDDEDDGHEDEQNNHNAYDYYSEAILKLLLEHLYSGIIYTLTDSVQFMLEQNPNLDVREILGSSVNVLRNVLNDMSFHGDQSCIFLGGVDVFGPIPSEIRNYTSKILCQECSKSKSIIYAILSINKQLFNIIQPQSKQHQLQPFDINLLLHFINSQTQTINNELWFPICLPTLSTSGFVHGYQCCLTSGLESFKLTIISTDPSIEEFERLRNVAMDIRTEMGLIGEESKEQILRIYNLDCKKGGGDSTTCITDDHLVWERTSMSEKDDNDNESDNEYTVDVLTLEKKRFGYQLLRCIKKSLLTDYQKHITQSYCEIASVIDFVFRYNAPIQNYESGSNMDGGNLSQCFNPSMKFIDEPVSKKRIWNIYQKLSLRLRIDSASPQESMKIMDNSDSHHNQQGHEHSNTETNHEFVVQGDWKSSHTLFQSRCCKDCFTYVVEENCLFLALSGEKYEFYATLPGSTSPLDANTLCGVLIDTLLNDTKDLLQCNPLSF